MAASLAALEAQAHRRVIESLDEKALREAARRVCAARQVVLFGVFQNRYLGMNLAYRLGQIGIDCLVPEARESELMARGMGPEHCALLVSYSGLGLRRPPAVLVPSLRERHVPCVAITNSGDNWLRHSCDCVLGFPPAEHLYSKIAGYYSEAATSFVLDLLYSLCFQARFEKNVWSKLDAAVANEQRMQTTDVLPE
jgi:DNA-binding MurR/RpiR family transcriptional regulator